MKFCIYQANNAAKALGVKRVLNSSDFINSKDGCNEIKIVEYFSLLKKQIQYAIENRTAHVESGQRITTASLQGNIIT